MLIYSKLIELTDRWHQLFQFGELQYQGACVLNVDSQINTRWKYTVHVLHKTRNYYGWINMESTKMLELKLAFEQEFRFLTIFLIG